MNVNFQQRLKERLKENKSKVCTWIDIMSENIVKQQKKNLHCIYTYTHYTYSSQAKMCMQKSKLKKQQKEARPTTTSTHFSCISEYIYKFSNSVCLLVYLLHPFQLFFRVSERDWLSVQFTWKVNTI